MYNIVIVDDEPWGTAVLMEAIDWNQFGFQVDRLYTKPWEALKDICIKSPDVVITDISMPMLNGLDLIHKAQADGCTSRFVILTAYKNFDYVHTAIKLEVVDYCLKPINPDEIVSLFDKIKKQLDAECHPSKDPEFTGNCFDNILTYIQVHMQEQMSLQLISDTFFINRTYICDLFKKNLNITFSQYLTDIRLEKARFLLINTDLKHSEIASKVGFKDEFYFNKVFKKAEYIPPGLYRKLNR